MDSIAHPPSVKTITSSRIGGIDGLRAISLLLVLQAHWAPSATFEKVAEWGRGGLLIFFVISGFLITRILIGLHHRRNAESSADLLKNFYARRFFRIQPIYYLSLAFLIYMGLSDAVARDWFWHVLFLQNLSNVFLCNDIGVYGPAAPWWSLAVEEQFYVFWAPLVIFLRPPAWKAALVGAFAMGIGWRLFAWYAGLGQANVLVTFGNLDSLAAGAVVAIVTAYGRVSATSTRIFSAVMVFGIAAFCLLSAIELHIGLADFRSRIIGKVFSDVPVYLIASSLIFFLATGKAKAAASVLDSRILVFIGKRSYGAYVYHQVVNFTFYYYITPEFLEPNYGIKLGLHGPWEFVVFGAVTLTLATLSYRFMEQPIFEFRDRLVPRTA